MPKRPGMRVPPKQVEGQVQQQAHQSRQHQVRRS